MMVDGNGDGQDEDDGDEDGDVSFGWKIWTVALPKSNRQLSEEIICFMWQYKNIRKFL